MATVAAVIASTHHPFYYRASTATGNDRPPFADEWVAKIEAFRTPGPARAQALAGAYPACRGGLRKYAAGVTPVSRRNAATNELADS